MSLFQLIGSENLVMHNGYFTKMNEVFVKGIYYIQTIRGRAWACSSSWKNKQRSICHSITITFVWLAWRIDAGLWRFITRGTQVVIIRNCIYQNSPLIGHNINTILWNADSLISAKASIIRCLTSSMLNVVLLSATLPLAMPHTFSIGLIPPLHFRR